MLKSILCAVALSAATSAPLYAQEVKITPDMGSASFDLAGRTYEIARTQNTEARIEDGFARTARACPPFCIHAMSAGDGVETIGELEVIDFLKTHVSGGTGLLIDSRLPDFYAQGTIPGAINVPFTALEANAFLADILKALGARETASGMDFSGAMDLALFCNGPWCDQSPRAIRDLLAAGYPAEKLHYYRGGMQLWLLLGLTVERPQT